MKIRWTYPWNKGSPSSFDNLNWSFGVFCGFWPETCWKSINDILKSWPNGLASRRKFVSTDLRNGEKNLRRLAYEFQLDQNHNASWQNETQVERNSKTCVDLRRLAGPFGQSLKRRVGDFCWCFVGREKGINFPIQYYNWYHCIRKDQVNT